MAPSYLGRDRHEAQRDVRMSHCHMHRDGGSSGLDFQFSLFSWCLSKKRARKFQARPPRFPETEHGRFDSRKMCLTAAAFDGLQDVSTSEQISFLRQCVDGYHSTEGRTKCREEHGQQRQRNVVLRLSMTSVPWTIANNDNQVQATPQKRQATVVRNHVHPRGCNVIWKYSIYLDT